MAKLTWFWPVLNGLIGLIATIIAFILAKFIHFDPFLIATIVYGFLLLINGFNHFDGLMDFGDGVMVHGSPEKKLSIMKDPMTGVGGIATGFIVGTITIAAFTSLINYFVNALPSRLLMINLLDCLLFLRVLRPRAGLPQGVTGPGRPILVLPSPPPCG